MKRSEIFLVKCRYVCPIVIEFRISRQIFIFHINPSSGSRVDAYGQKDVETVRWADVATVLERPFVRIDQAGSCKGSNEPSGSIKCWEFLD